MGEEMTAKLNLNVLFWVALACVFLFMYCGPEMPIVCQILAETGNANAQYNLGLWYYGDYWAYKDKEQAVKWWRKAAERGHAGAQCGLGWCYEKGEGVATDAAEAVKWYGKAAEQGLAEAKNALKGLSEKSDGVKTNTVEAVNKK